MKGGVMYEVRGYYGNNFVGLAESYEVETYEEAVDKAHGCCSNALYTVITQHPSGGQVRFTPDEWMEAIDFGDVPEKIKALAFFD